jgi:hypothetical protein
LYTNLSLIPNNLQKIKQELNAIFQWVAHLVLEQRNQLLVMTMGTLKDTVNEATTLPTTPPPPTTSPATPSPKHCKHGHP